MTTFARHSTFYLFYALTSPVSPVLALVEKLSPALSVIKQFSPIYFGIIVHNRMSRRIVNFAFQKDLEPANSKGGRHVVKWR